MPEGVVKAVNDTFLGADCPAAESGRRGGRKNARPDHLSALVNPDSDPGFLSVKGCRQLSGVPPWPCCRARRLRWRGDEFFEDINHTLAAYIRAQLTACFIIGAVCSIGFWLIGLPSPLVLGLMAGILEFVPLVGPLMVAILVDHTRAAALRLCHGFRRAAVSRAC